MFAQTRHTALIFYVGGVTAAEVALIRVLAQVPLSLSLSLCVCVCVCVCVVSLSLWCFSLYLSLPFLLPLAHAPSFSPYPFLPPPFWPRTTAVSDQELPLTAVPRARTHTTRRRATINQTG